MTPTGIESPTYRFVSQHINYCATAVPRASYIHLPMCIKNLPGLLRYVSYVRFSALPCLHLKPSHCHILFFRPKTDSQQQTTEVDKIQEGGYKGILHFFLCICMCCTRQRELLLTKDQRTPAGSQINHK